MSDPGTPPAPAPTPSGDDNAVIRQMREQIEAANRAAKEAADAKAAIEAQLKEIERRDMDEKTRLQAELQDAQQIAQEVQRLRDENGKFISWAESQYNAKLAAVPEEKRALVQQLSAQGDWAARVSSLDAVAALIGITAAPVQAGTITQPTGGTPPAAAGTTPEPAKPLDINQIERMSLGDAIAARRQMHTRQP